MSLGILQDVEKSLAPLYVCTFMKTGDTPLYQISYFCHDCNPTMNETYCEACAKICHEGHHTMKTKNLNTYCFCGKKLHRVPEHEPVKDKACTFWEFDDCQGRVMTNKFFNHCKQCNRYYCSFCVFFCHYHHIDHLYRITSRKANRCSCTNTCHKDNRVLYFYLKDYSQFRLEGLYNTHMMNMLLECNDTFQKIFSKYLANLRDIFVSLEKKKFQWKRSLVTSSSPFHRALTCLYFAMRNVSMCYFSSETKEKLLPVNLTLMLCLDDGMDDKYEVKLTKKNMLYLMYKFHLMQDFGRYPRYSTKDYSNISCLHRLFLYNSIRNDTTIRFAYLDDLSFRVNIIKLLEKYSNQCKIDDHVSLALFSTILTIVKLLMQYGVFNAEQIRMICDILEKLFKSLKIENTPVNNEEFKENIFKKIPPLLYIMIYAYNDYIFLESFLYDKTGQREFAVGKSSFGSKMVATIFLSNVRYILKFHQSKRFLKTLILTFKSLALLSSENDHFLKTLFNTEKHELYNFVIFYKLGQDAKYNDNYPFINQPGDEQFVLGIPKFINIKMINSTFTKTFADVMKIKTEIENSYVDYFTMKITAEELVGYVMKKLDDYLRSVDDVEILETIPKGAMVEMISFLDKVGRNIPLPSKRSGERDNQSDIQLAIVKTGMLFSVLKLLKICHMQDELIIESNFRVILRLVEFYTQDSVASTINFLSSAYLKYIMLFLNKFPHLVLKFIHSRLRYLKNKKYSLCDYTYLYNVLKDSFSGKYTKTEDADDYVNGFLFHIKCLKLLKEHLPSSLVRDMKTRIREFMERLRKEDLSVKEYFWVNAFKRRLLLKESDYLNLLQYEKRKEEERKMSKEERERRYMTSEAMWKRMKRQQGNDLLHYKKKERGNVDNTNHNEEEDGSLMIVGDNQEDIVIEHEIKEEEEEENEVSNNEDFEDMIMKKENQVVVIKGGTEVGPAQAIEPMVKKPPKENEIKETAKVLMDADEDDIHLGLENVHNLQLENINIEVKIEEFNVENSTIQIEEALHQQLAGDNPSILVQNLEDEKMRILEPPEEDDHDQSDINVSELYGNNITLKKDDDLIQKEEELLFPNFEYKQPDEDRMMNIEISQIEIEVQKSKEKRRKDINQKKREESQARRILAAEKKGTMNEKIMKNKSTATAFLKFIDLVNYYTEDSITGQFQDTLRRYFPRNDISLILQSKRYLKDLALRSHIIKILQINYLHPTISKDEYNLSDIVLNNYEFSLKDSKSTQKVAAIARILLYELTNLQDIVAPNFDLKEQLLNVIEPAEQRKVVKKLKKKLRLYLTEGLLKSLKIFADKVYSHGLNITGEELCEIYQVFFNFIKRRLFIEELLLGKSLEDAVNNTSDKNLESNLDNPMLELEELFSDLSGGVENFNRKCLFKIFYTNLNKTFEIAFPLFRKNLGDIWFSLNKRINNVGYYDGIEFLPLLIDNMSKISLSKDATRELSILNEYGKICKYYLMQSKNFRQSPILSSFNCMMNEAEFNYRDMFVRLFIYSYVEKDLRNMEANCLLDIMNKVLEYDYVHLQPVIYKYIKDITPVLTKDFLVNFQKTKKKCDINCALFNEINHMLIYNMIILFVYINRYDAYHIFEHANYTSHNIIKFYQLLAKNPTNDLHNYVLKLSHTPGTDDINTFRLIEALLGQILRLSRWGREYDLRNEIYFDNLFVVFHIIIGCLSDYAREADEAGVALIYSRIKSIIYAFKKILYYDTFSGENDLIFEIKLSIMHLLLSMIEEGNAVKILDELSFYFDPYRLFKLCMFLFKVLIKMHLDRDALQGDLSVKKPLKNNPEFIELNLYTNLNELIRLRNKDGFFANSSLLAICYKIYFYLKILKDTYANRSAIKCFYAIKRFKKIWQGPQINDPYKMKSMNDYKFLNETGTLADTFLESDEITETEYVIYKFLKQGIGCIEVFTNRQKLEYVFFPIIPLTKYLRNDSYDIFMDNLYERSDSHMKIERLMLYVNQALEECYYSHHLHETSKLLAFIEKMSNFLLFKIIICLFNAVICYFVWSILDETDEEKIKKENDIAWTLDIINFGYMVVVFILWFAIRFYPRFKTIKIKYQRENKLSTEKPLKPLEYVRVLLWDICICDFDFLYLFSTMIFCLFSIIYKIHSLKFFQMLNFLILSSDLFRLIKFLGKHWFEIFMLYVMLFIFLLTTTSMSKDYYAEYPTSASMYLQGNVDNQTNYFCQYSFSTCLFLWIFYGMRFHEGISVVLDNNFVSYDGGKYLKRLILDVGVDVFIRGLWLTLFVAIILVSYFDYTKSKNLMERDKASRCFICHLDKDIFLKYKLNFERHVKNEHNVKNYIFFIMYILTKNPENLTKVEKYVLDKFRMNDIFWVPSQDTRVLQMQVRKIKDKKLMLITPFN